MPFVMKRIEILKVISMTTLILLTTNTLVLQNLKPRSSVRCTACGNVVSYVIHSIVA